MIPQLARKFQKLEAQKQSIASALAGWPEARRAFRPGPALWSTLDVLDHVARVERAFAAEVRVNLLSYHSVSPKERAGALMVNLAMMTPVRIQVPAGAEAVLPSPADQQTIERQWNESRLAVAEVLETIEPGQLHFGVFRHPVAGWMTVSSGLAFLFAHVRHHRYQLDRLTKLTVHFT